MAPLTRFDLLQSVVTEPSCPSDRSVAAQNSVSGGADGTSSGHDEPRVEYVTHLERSCDGVQVAAALSSMDIKLFSRDTMLLCGELSGHTGPLTGLAFAPSDSRGLFSASEDGTVRGWDSRSRSTTVTFGQSGEEVWSMALSFDGRLCATGKGCTVDFYDLRKAGAPLGTYSECHTDAVTQVRFHPGKHSLMITGSEDGLMCFFDTAAPNEEEALDSVMNAECAVRTVGFFGPEGGGVYCCTNTETLSIWNAAGAQRIADFGDVRAIARGERPEHAGEEAGKSGKRRRKKKWGVPVDCIVGCQYEASGDRLLLVTSSFDGKVCVATVTPKGIVPGAVLEGGHTEQVRAVAWLGSTMATGGEDAKVCLWQMPREDVAAAAVQGEDENAMDVGDGPGEGSIGAGEMSHPTGGEQRADKRARRAYDGDDRRR